MKKNFFAVFFACTFLLTACDEGSSNSVPQEMQYIKRNEEELRILEDRIRSADVKLYDKIDQNIFETRSSINDSNDTLEELRSLMRRFEFVANMMQDTDNAERYELVYTKS
mgnify:CR=1 FL=1